MLVYMAGFLLTVLLVKIAIEDILHRTIKHSDLLCLMALLLLSWRWQANLAVWPYTLGILLVGFALFYLGVLGAGDTKLLAVLSLGISPQFMPIMLYGTALCGGVLALGYLIYGYATDLAQVRKKGVPYAVPITLMGGVSVFLTYLAR